VALLKK